uniref:Uncharacterized protein n=1 Tax=Candidatus Kentrum sp. LFY TaxID=2126342 RepID=A0A450WMI3_9GAMM|nr:MAG: hypothetical protein BECKLFY1418C_GA0070996_104023 [Candidatus Kentron sp. LFY]
MLALYAEVERGWALILATVCSEFLFFRYVKQNIPNFILVYTVSVYGKSVCGSM